MLVTFQIISFNINFHAFPLLENYIYTLQVNPRREFYYYKFSCNAILAESSGSWRNDCIEHHPFKSYQDL